MGSDKQLLKENFFSQPFLEEKFIIQLEVDICIAFIEFMI